ncbi:MAG: exopolysaccharide biosynthesis protein, partial [Pseudomonadota bacterium]
APGIGVAIASVGLLERDGLLVLAGLALGLAWVALLVFGFIFLGAEALDIIKDFILGRSAEA